jgi:hypothetical protein
MKAPMQVVLVRTAAWHVLVVAATHLATLGEAALRQRHRGRAHLGFQAEQGRSNATRSLAMYRMSPYYHSTQDISNELQALATRCPGMEVKTVEGTSDDGRTRSVETVTIRGQGSSPVNKNFFLFGEHSRELISPESGLHLIKSLCGETDLKDKAAEVLKTNEFQIVVNGNAESRKKVEQGEFCLRVNPEGVDLNRNWDEKWESDSLMAQTSPGPKPFSEPETRAFKQLVEEYRPTNFLTVHSGTKGMYMPWAYDMEHLATRNQPAMMQILKDLDRDHCQCPFGAAGKEVGYSCPGTCLDWVYDKLQTPYAFAFEIYTGPEYSDQLKERWEEKMNSEDGAFIQANSHLGHAHFHELFAKHPTDFVQLRSQRGFGGDMSAEECFSQFNPKTEAEYNSVVENWSSAYLDMASMVASRLQSSGATSMAEASPASNATSASAFANFLSP